MKVLALPLIFLVLVTSVDAGSPTISVKRRSIKQDGINYGFNIAVNTTTGESLVTWDACYGGKTGALISARGKLIGKPFLIVALYNDPDACFWGSSIAYNPVLQEYFVVYSPEKVGSILAVRLDSHRKVKGKEITVLPGINPTKPNDLGDNSFPHLIFNPKTNGYIMIWERTEGIAAALLDENGKLTSPIKIIKTNPASNGFYDDQRTAEGRIEDVQWLASGKKLLVVFQQRFTGPRIFTGPSFVLKIFPGFKSR